MYGAGGVRVGACFNFDGNVSRNFFVVFHEGVFRCSGGFCKGFRDVFGGPKSCSRGWGESGWMCSSEVVWCLVFITFM